MVDNIDYKWCTPDDTPLLEKLVEFFVSNTANNYISHGEVIDGRANNMHEWKANIKKIMKEEFAEAMSNTFDSADIFTKLVVTQQDDTIIALALLQFYPATKVSILCDIVVDAPYRKQKIGESLLAWIETEVKRWGAKSIFLESGLQNKSAHHFFERIGFRTVSVMMMKDIKNQDNK